MPLFRPASPFSTKTALYDVSLIPAGSTHTVTVVSKVGETIESDGDEEQPCCQPRICHNNHGDGPTSSNWRWHPSNSPENPSYLLPDDLRRFSHASQVSTLSSSLGPSQFPISPSYATFSKGDSEEGEPTKLKDSGFYGSTQPWKPPLPLPLSPRTGTGTVSGLLHSPFGSLSRRVNGNSGLMSPGSVSPMGGSFVPRLPQNRGLATGEMAGYGTDKTVVCLRQCKSTVDKTDFVEEDLRVAPPLRMVVPSKASRTYGRKVTKMTTGKPLVLHTLETPRTTLSNDCGFEKARSDGRQM
ncbi:hypothetical protein PQX77_010669 [Marasmius sp. AFHP31]|nr:hypothetical protein PQX77_010669 [Marasmius sp. AFHP31]